MPGQTASDSDTATHSLTDADRGASLPAPMDQADARRTSDTWRDLIEVVRNWPQSAALIGWFESASGSFASLIHTNSALSPAIPLVDGDLLHAVNWPY
jgi:hypothetical protein